MLTRWTANQKLQLRLMMLSFLLHVCSYDQMFYVCFYYSLVYYYENNLSECLILIRKYLICKLIIKGVIHTMLRWITNIIIINKEYTTFFALINVRKYNHNLRYLECSIVFCQNHSELHSLW